jgi:signal peptidase I
VGVRSQVALVLSATVAGVSVVAVVALFAVFDRYTVPSSSMEPTVPAGGSIWARAGTSGVDRGDIVVFRVPHPRLVGPSQRIANVS